MTCRSILRCVTCFGMALIFHSCSADGSAVQERDSLNGYGPFQFGASFSDVYSRVAVLDFNSVGLRECMNEMALKGCLLLQEGDGAYYEIRDGIPFRLRLAFTTHGKLNDITLKHENDAGIAAEQCEELLARTFDWVQAEVGPLSPVREKPANGAITTTEGGVEYRLDRAESGGFVGLMGRKFPDQREVSVLGAFIPLSSSKKICKVDVSFQDDSLRGAR